MDNISHSSRTNMEIMGVATLLNVKSNILEKMNSNLCVLLNGSLTQSKKLVRCHKVSGIALTMCCILKVRRLFSSLSREMLTFSRLIQHNSVTVGSPYMAVHTMLSTLVGFQLIGCEYCVLISVCILQLLEACVKNCGKPLHQELGKFRFLNDLIRLISPKVRIVNNYF